MITINSKVKIKDSLEDKIFIVDFIENNQVVFMHNIKDIEDYSDLSWDFEELELV